MNFTIRPATERDAAVVSSILREAAEWLATEGMPMWTMDVLSQEKIREAIEGYYVAEDPLGTPVGVVKLQMEDGEFWPDARGGESVFVHRLAIRRAFASRGLSKSLLDFAVRRAESLGRRFVRLDCASHRPKLRAIYAHYGFSHHSDRVVGQFHVARYEYDLKRRSPRVCDASSGLS